MTTTTAKPTADSWALSLSGPVDQEPVTHEVIQGTPEWLELRRGKVTASCIRQLLTPTRKLANNDKSRAHVRELAVQRITGFVEPHYVSDHMQAGTDEEPIAIALYSERYAPVERVGFMERRLSSGSVLGYSPDGLVGTDGQIEVKRRVQRRQLETILAGAPPADDMPQIQAGLLVSGRSWCDYVSYCGGMPLVVMRVHPDPAMFSAIREAVEETERTIAAILGQYESAIATMGWQLTERHVWEIQHEEEEQW